jgi:hypothetical protein
MKNSFIGLAMVLSISLAANCQGLKVPDAVKNAFSLKYPGASNVKWGKENAKEFEAEFKLNNNSMSANFGSDGNWVETESGIPVSELPAPVSAAIKAKYPGGIVSVAEKTEQPGNKVFYEVVVKVNGKKRSMELKADGTPVK